MKSLIVFESIHHGNTEKIARAMADSLGADVCRADSVDAGTLKDYDLVGFGSGIYFGKFDKKILDLVDSIPDESGKKAFVFSTSGLGNIRYNEPLEQKLKGKHFKVVGDYACKGFDTTGPFKIIGGIAKGRPDDDDIKKAEEFAGKIKEV